MFGNIGGKIKTTAKILCILGIIISLVNGILIISRSTSYNSTVVLGLVSIIVGSLLSWISSFFLYGWGELIEKTGENNEALTRIEQELSVMNGKIGAKEANRPEGNDFTAKL